MIAPLASSLRRQYGRIDILVNNSGVYEFGPPETVTEAQFYKMFDSNVLYLLLVRQAATDWPSPGDDIEALVISQATVHENKILVMTVRRRRGRQGVNAFEVNSVARRDNSGPRTRSSSTGGTTARTSETKSCNAAGA